MKRFTAVASVAALFLSGVAIGGLGVHLIYLKLLRRPSVEKPVEERMFGQHLERELGLSAEQSHEIQQILEESRARAADLRVEMQPRVHELMAETSRRIEEVLTPDQKERFARLREMHRRRSELFMLGPPGGGPRGPHRDRPPRRR